MQSFTQRLLMPFGAKSMLEDFVLITHAVPASRVRRHLPEGIEPETYFDEHGQERAFVSVASFYNRGFKPGPLPLPRFSFGQITYRAYVRHRERRGVYFFATALTSRPVFALQRATSRIVHLGEFDRDKQVAGEGYENYSFEMRSPSVGLTRFELRADERPRALPPFTDGDEHAQFLSYRQHGFMEMPGGKLGDQQVDHARMNPLSGVLRSGRFEHWERLGILKPSETLDTYSVLVQPRIAFTLFPPVPLMLLPLSERHPDGETARVEEQRYRKAA